MAWFNKHKQIHIDKKTHLLVLDQKWHELFNNKKPSKILTLEKKLNALLKEQGKLTTESKEYYNLKKKIMQEIVDNMSETNAENEKDAFHKMEKNRRNIEEINDKLKQYEKRLDQLPMKIEQVNRELVTVTMNIFYLEMLDVRAKSQKHDKMVKKLREEIKEEIIARDETKERSDALYSFIHDVVGSDVIEQYDDYYLKGNEK
jgi:seryl-tRNA synthetase